MDEIKGKYFKGSIIEKNLNEPNDNEAIRALMLDPDVDVGIFTFKVRLCDNALDRDYEMFSQAALESMQTLFVGRTFIKDHRHLTDNQIARIYEASVKTEPTPKDVSLMSGQEYLCLVAKVYMLDTPENASLIGDIKAGIKKEVSIGFFPKSAVCSICGTDNMVRMCSHWNGVEYDGKLCYFVFGDVADVYEASFVSVPAQRLAGTKKDYTGKEEPPYEEPQKEPSDKEERLKKRLQLAGVFHFMKERNADEQENA